MCAISGQWSCTPACVLRFDHTRMRAAYSHRFMCCLCRARSKAQLVASLLLKSLSCSTWRICRCHRTQLRWQSLKQLSILISTFILNDYIKLISLIHPGFSRACGQSSRRGLTPSPKQRCACYCSAQRADWRSSCACTVDSFAFWARITRKRCSPPLRLTACLLSTVARAPAGRPLKLMFRNQCPAFRRAALCLLKR